MEAITKPPYRFATAIAALIFPLFFIFLMFYNLGAASAQTSLWEDLQIDGGTVSDATIDPKTGRAFLVTDRIPGIYWSDYNGDNWQVNPYSQVGGGGAIEIGPDGALYATVATGFQRSTNSGLTWTTLADESKAFHAATINGSDIDPKNVNHMLIATGGEGDGDGAIYTTLDGATTWFTATLSTLPSSDVFDLAIDPTRDGVVYATSHDSWYTDTLSQIYRSTDGGLSFTPVFTAPQGVQFQQVAINSLGTAYAGSSMGVFRSEDGIDWDFSGIGGGMVSFGVSDPQIIYVDHALSLDDGHTWAPSQINTFAAGSPDNPDLIFTAGPMGIQRSYDSGSTWEDCVTGIHGVQILSVASDPFDNQILYAATSHGAARSLDAGITWSFPLGGPKLTINDIAVDAGQSGVLYLGASDGKVYKSTNYGETFTLPESAVKTNFAIKDLAINPWRTNNIYAATLMPAETENVYGGLFRSEDFASTWLSITLKAKNVNTIQAGLLLTNTVLYAGLGDYWQGSGLEGGGVYRSLDGGKSWLAVGMRYKVVSSLAVDPRDGYIVYAGMGTAFDSGYGQYLYWSHDMGEEWDPLPLEIESFSIEALNVDANDPETIYACTQNQVYISRDSGKSWSPFYTSRSDERCRGIYTPQQGPGPVRFLAPSLNENSIQLQWENPNDRDLSGVHLRMLTTTFPTAHTLGISLTTQTAVPDGAGVYVYTNVEPGTTYYFSAFALDQAGRFSPPAYISVTVPLALSSPLQSIDRPAESDLKVQVVYLVTGKGIVRYTETRVENSLYLPSVLRLR